MDGQKVWFFIPPEVQYGRIYSQRVIGEFNGTVMLEGYRGDPQPMAAFWSSHPTERAARLALAGNLRELAAELIAKAEENERVAAQEVVEV